MLGQIKKIRIPQMGYPVEKKVAEAIRTTMSKDVIVEKISSDRIQSGRDVFYTAVANKSFIAYLTKRGIQIPQDLEWALFDVDENHCCWMISSKPYFLYALYSHIWENHLAREPNEFPLVWTMSFDEQKSTFDLFLTQYARLIRNFDREHYVREYARLGFTHIEVNALASPFPLEQGVEGEFYADFYTYCPALDQFVSSRLNEGIYPKEYLSANLNVLKENAQLAVDHGLVPGMLCFEPRSVPESLLQKYPSLRGARVDHPFRSFMPRFNLSTVHPVVQKHYAGLMTRLLEEVPELEFLTIWSNDSGAGFEHTKSLYVGRNGGAYLIREWKDDDEIAKAASENVVNFFKVLRDAASRINPKFRVVTRLESFYGEREHLWPEMRNGIGVEAHSLLTKGWESHYPHPRYSDIKVIGSAYQNTFSDEERKPMEQLLSQKSFSFFYHSFGSHTNHEPLLGIPFPWLTYEKLQACYNLGIRTLAHLGGIHPPDKVPYAVNQEIFRMFQFDPLLDVDNAVKELAVKFAGRKYALDLVEGWRLVEQAIRSFPPLSIYTHYGTVWQRLLVRPLVPNIDIIPEEERTYYEDHMCAPIHNPNKIDLSMDVLFKLVSKEYAQKAYSRIDKNVWAPLNAAISLFGKIKETIRDPEENQALRVFEDQYFRIKALKCLYETLRNTAVWIFAVHEFMETKDPSQKDFCKKLLEEMIETEILNSLEFLNLWDEAPVEWMIVSGSEETPFIHSDNFPLLLEKKIDLMKKYGSAEPYIDTDYMYRVEGNPYEEAQ